MMQRNRDSKLFLMQRKEILQKIKEDQLIELKNLIIRKARHAALSAKIILCKNLVIIWKGFQYKLDQRLLKFQMKMAKFRLVLLWRKYKKRCRVFNSNFHKQRIKFSLSFLMNQKNLAMEQHKRAAELIKETLKVSMRNFLVLRYYNTVVLI